MYFRCRRHVWDFTSYHGQESAGNVCLGCHLDGEATNSGEGVGNSGRFARLFIGSGTSGPFDVQVFKTILDQDRYELQTA